MSKNLDTKTMLIIILIFFILGMISFGLVLVAWQHLKLKNTYLTNDLLDKYKEYYEDEGIVMIILISYILVNSNSDRKMQKCHQIEDPQLQVNCIAKVFQEHPERYSSF